MWIYTSGAFVSAVKHRDKNGTILLRARLRGHLETFIRENVENKNENLFIAREIKETPDGDYRFRVEIPIEVFAAAAAKAARSITYDNFKNSIDSILYHDAALGAWRAAWNAQAEETQGEEIEDRLRLYRGELPEVLQEDDGEVDL